MTTLESIVTQVSLFFGPMGSPYWWLLAAVAASVFLATWARAIRTLLPFIGAGTIIALIVWTLVKMNIIVLNV